MNGPLCFIIMPFGKKRDADGAEVNFDEVYKSYIKPAVEAAGMEPVRADEETVNGIIHKPMYERLILCDYAVADLTTANANVFYEVGIRHAVKPCTTITVFAANSKLPFDVNFLRCLPYGYHPEHGLTGGTQDVEALTKSLLNAKRERTTDSPVYQLVDGIHFQNSLAHEKTDIFRDKVKYNNDIKEQLAAARKRGGKKEERLKSIDAIAQAIQPEDEETGVLIDIMLSYRSAGAYDKMLQFINVMPAHVKQTVMVQEQTGFALNRVRKHEEAIAVLEKVLQANGPSSETNGILGRVYKDLFEKATEDGNELLAEAYLDKALESYLEGFESDWRDAYPGVNVLTLLELKNEKEMVKQLAPVVEYAVIRKLDKKEPEYWDYATLLELAVIENNENKARTYLKKALACKIEGDWMLDTTINNLDLILQYRKRRGDDTAITQKIIQLLATQQKVAG